MKDSEAIHVHEYLVSSLDKLRALRDFSGTPGEFWRLYTEALAILGAARSGICGTFVAGAKPEWRVLGAYSGGSGDYTSRKENSGRDDGLETRGLETRGLETRGLETKVLEARLPEAGSSCAEDGAALLSNGPDEIIAVSLQTMGSQPCVAMFNLGPSTHSEAVERIDLLKTGNDVAALYQLRMSTRTSEVGQDAFAGVLDFMAVLNAHEAFLACAMSFCNELTSRFQCERVSLGWLQKGYLRLQAMSHMDQFDKKMDAVQKLEGAMEEAADQDAEILFPAPAEARTVSKDHEAFAKAHDVDRIFSLPLRIGGRVVAVCTLERGARPFTDTDQRVIRLACDQAGRRLDDLKRNDRWFGALLAERFRKGLEPWLGFEHTWAKIIGIGVTVIMAVLCFLPVTYRLEAPIILRTDDIAYLTAPFDGHIEKVNVRLGDAVQEHDEVLQLDKNSLLMDEAGLVAEINRYQREGEKARAADALADMRIAEAQHDQSAARLEAVRFKLSQSSALSPFAGVIVEGDLRERVGSPVKQGDMLFKIARTDKIYAELEVRESEIQNVKMAMQGEVTLASRPYDTFGAEVIRIIPSAVVKKDGNAFLVHCDFKGAKPDWWRPGMTGLAKLNAGKRTLLWIFTHRTLDFLRLKFWW